MSVAWFIGKFKCENQANRSWATLYTVKRARQEDGENERIVKEGGRKRGSDNWSD